MISSRSRSTSANGSPCSGGDSGSAARTSPGATRGTTGRSPTVSMYDETKSRRRVEVVAEGRHRFFRSFRSCASVRVLTTSSFVSHARRAWPTPSST